MAEIKDKVVTVESLSALHDYNKKMYMPMVNPEAIGNMTVDGNGVFSGNMRVASLTIGSNIKLVPTADSLEIVFLTDDITQYDINNDGILNDADVEALMNHIAAETTKPEWDFNGDGYISSTDVQMLQRIINDITTGNDNTGNDNTGNDNTGNDNTGGEDTGGEDTGGEDTGGDTGIVYTDVTNLTVSSYKTTTGQNYSCSYCKNISVVDGKIVADEKLTVTSVVSLDTMTDTLLDNYLILSGIFYYIPKDANFTTSSSVSDFVTTNTLKVDKAQRLSLESTVNE